MSTSAAEAPEKAGLLERLDQLYEFEREPVTEDNLQPGSYFAGVFSGEHMAGTEFVIGALFVQFGAASLRRARRPAGGEPAGGALLDVRLCPDRRADATHALLVPAEDRRAHR